ncbi:MAG: DsbA family protein [Fulvivirga sp.]
MIVKDKAKREPGETRVAKLEIEYYTDPLCCWSWGFEPQWRRLRYEYAESLNWRYVVGGMLVDWNSYNDPVNSVSKPAQMGPVWKEAKHLSGMPVNDHIWVENPPKSSYPACLAVKAAGRQGPEAEEKYLRKAREAVMTDLVDISQREVLLSLAGQVAEDNPDAFDPVKFRKDLVAKSTLDLLKKDLRKVKIQGISRYPSLVIKSDSRRGVIITGYRPYEVVVQAMRQVMPDIKPSRKINLNDYKKYWSNLTERELEEVMSENCSRYTV